MGESFSCFVPQHENIESACNVSRTYDNKPPSGCVILKVNGFFELQTIKKALQESKNKLVVRNKNKVLRFLHNIHGRSNLIGISYFSFSTKSLIILIIENKNTEEFFDSIGQKWNYIHCNLDYL